MKKIILILLLICIAAYGAEKKKAEVKKAEVKKIATWTDWKEYGSKAVAAQEVKEYLKASELYLKQVEAAKDLKRPDLEAWGLNNAGYMLILLYQKQISDPGLTLKPASSYFMEALKIKEIVPECKAHAEKNLRYCGYITGGK